MSEWELAAAQLIVCDSCGNDFHPRERVIVRSAVDFCARNYESVRLGETICATCLERLELTGCRFNGIDYEADPLGVDEPPPGWVRRAFTLREQLEALAGAPFADAA